MEPSGKDQLDRSLDQRTAYMMIRNIYILVLLLAAMTFNGCATRKVNKDNTKIHLVEQARIERKSPGDRVYIEYPRTPNERPKGVTQTNKGTKGAETRTTFDQTGTITRIETDCPEINEIEQRNREWDYKKKEKDSERSFNTEIAKLGSKTLIWIAGIFAVAWVARGFIKK